MDGLQGCKWREWRATPIKPTYTHREKEKTKKGGLNSRSTRNIGEAQAEWEGVSSCLQSTLPPADVAVAPPNPEPQDLTTIPSKCHDISLCEVLRKDLALSLQPHRPYN